MRHVTTSLIVLASLLCPARGQKAGLTPIQTARIRTVAAVYPSPDGKQIAFLRREPRTMKEEPGGSYLRLYAVPSTEPGGERLLVGGKRSIHGVAYRPGRPQITFIDRRDDAAHPEVYAIDLRGGEPTRLTHTERGVSRYEWRPDGKALAYTSRDAKPEARAAARRMGFKPIVVDEDFDHISLWLWNAESAASERLTEGVTVNSFEWAPSGKAIVAGIAPRNLIDDRYMANRLYLIDVAGGHLRRLVDNPGKLGPYAVSPDGRSLAYASAEDPRDPHAGMLFLLDVKSGETRHLTRGWAGMVHEVSWWDDERILVTASIGVKTYVGTVNVETGELKAVAGGKRLAFRSAKAIPGQEAFAVVGSTAKHPSEVVRLDWDDQWLRLTDSNPWLAGVAIGRQETARFEARDGLVIEGILMYPLGHDPERRYPMVIVAHGGPESHFSEGWNTDYGRWGQMLAARGYFAWYPNYRSSTGYGVEFAKKDHGDPMGAEFEDHLDAIRVFSDRGLIDPARVGIGGGSYGGYTAAWAATRHSKHFAAAVSFVPFVDIRTKWLTTDIPNEFYHVHYEEKWPHEQADFLAERSPLTYAPYCNTPLLVLGGTADPRVHPSQPHMLYRAVKTSTHTPVRYVQYPGEGHGNRINTNRYDYCVRSLRWLDHYLKEGDHRMDAPPPLDLDYSDWK